MRIETFKCDVCGVTKGETNHWWQLGVQASYKLALLQPQGGGFIAGRGLLNSAQNAYNAASAGQQMEWFDLCGQDCVNRKLAEVMK